MLVVSSSWWAWHRQYGGTFLQRQDGARQDGSHPLHSAHVVTADLQLCAHHRNSTTETGEAPIRSTEKGTGILITGLNSCEVFFCSPRGNSLVVAVRLAVHPSRYSLASNVLYRHMYLRAVCDVGSYVISGCKQ